MYLKYSINRFWQRCTQTWPCPPRCGGGVRGCGGQHDPGVRGGGAQPGAHLGGVVLQVRLVVMVMVSVLVLVMKYFMVKRTMKHYEAWSMLHRDHEACFIIMKHASWDLWSMLHAWSKNASYEACFMWSYFILEACFISLWSMLHKSNLLHFCFVHEAWQTFGFCLLF